MTTVILMLLLLLSLMGRMLAWLSRARWRFAYGPDDATATHLCLTPVNPHWFGFTFLVLAQPGSPGKVQGAVKRL